MILEKDSSILGYPGEISKSMNADHHNVCKYDSPQDSNYIGVRNALKSLVARFRSVGRFPESLFYPESVPHHSISIVIALVYDYANLVIQRKDPSGTR
jgi:hypothetical protein